MLTTMTIPITISRKVQTRFKLRAWRAFPREFIGFLVGNRAQDHLENAGYVLPGGPERARHRRRIHTMAGHWWTLAMAYAAQQKMIVLESAHTLHLLGRGATKWKRFPASATWSPGRWRI